MSLDYYYFNPFNQQYLFPKGFKNYALFTGFYQAYTVKGKLLWWLWKNSFLVRNLCTVSNPHTIVPLEQLKKHLNNDVILAFNRGTTGIEQKITVLGIETKTNNEFFIKYAESETAKINVTNEAAILTQLTALDFVPSLLQHVTTPNYTFIQTNVLKGERVAQQPIHKQLLEVLTTLSKIKITTTREYTATHKTCFAHGDFCPWNMMFANNKLLVFDWEMAGIYPLGYDLFTYLFQTAFLITPNKSIEKIVKEHSELIMSYFNPQEIEQWLPYLYDFASVKLNLETEKNNQQLIPYYRSLKSYAEKV